VENPAIPALYIGVAKTAIDEMAVFLFAFLLAIFADLGVLNSSLHARGPRHMKIFAHKLEILFHTRRHYYTHSILEIHMNPSPVQRTTWILSGLVLLLIGALSYGGYRYYELRKHSLEMKAILEGRIAELEGNLGMVSEENRSLSEALYSEQQKNALFEEEIKELAGTVDVLDRLAKTDPELLQKYSKVYFLNEHYIPSNLRKIDQEFVYKQNEEEYIHSKVYADLKRLINDAREDGIELSVISAYRSFDEQAQLKGTYSVTYGNGANTFSADQGYSEHQLGTTVDFTTKALGTGFSAFEGSDAYTWLTENAYKYGFVLSYPKGNAYYVFEPWHWRYVGEELARKLNRDKKYFYDLDQREIDQYLIELFD